MTILRIVLIKIFLVCWLSRLTAIIKKAKWEDDWNDGHWVVPIGYDSKYIHFEDPACQYRTFLSYDELNKRWHDIDTPDKKLFHFGISFYGKPERFDEYESIHMD